VDRGFSHRHVLALKFMRVARARLLEATKTGQMADVTAAGRYYRRCKARVERYRLEMRR
jgi:hypothetical protein